MTDHGPTVQTQNGTLQGVEVGGLLAFKGIRFAQAPVGELRYRPPQPEGSWDGVRDATAFGPAAPQLESPGTAILGTEDLPEDEDCLTLNVWTPGADDARRPVMVWVHGGAFQIGSGSQAWYDGTTLAGRGDVVVVTLNYRLGALGFLHLEELGGPPESGNLGILDQVAALEWVRDNIAAFGGDRGNVTIFGESAGAMSVATLMATPAARGLFHKVIAQSGAASHVKSAERATAIARLFLDIAGVEKATQLESLPVEAILAAQGRLMTAPEIVGTQIGGGLPFGPVVDGTVLPEPPLGPIASGVAAGVALVQGTTQDEMKLFALMDPAGSSLDEGRLLARMRKVVGSEETAARLVAAYTEARQSSGADTTPPELWSAMATDFVFRVPATRLAEAQLPHAPVWSYKFTWTSPLLGGALGSCHALDVPFVWGTGVKGPTAAFVGDGPEARALATAMQDAWLAFARSGDPSTPSLPEWPAYDAACRPTMILGPDRRVEDDPESAERLAWEGVI